MKLRHLGVFSLLILLSAVFVLCKRSPPRDAGTPAVVKRQITLAVESVEAALGSMQGGGGYQRWTPGKAVEKLVPLMNSAMMPAPGEPELPGVAGKIRYVRDKVTAPWQIVLIPDDGKGVIRVEGYGRDTSKPVYTREIKVSEWG